MAIRDIYDRQMPVIWGGAVVTSESKQKIVSQCGFLRDNRNIALFFSAAFVATSGLMAKALHDRYPEIPEDHKSRYRFASKVISVVPIGIASLFFKWAYQNNVLYSQCLQDPRGTLDRLAADKREEGTHRVVVNTSAIIDAASGYAAAGAFAEVVVYYGAAVAEGVLASGLALCAPALRYFSLSRRAEFIL